MQRCGNDLEVTRTGTNIKSNCPTSTRSAVISKQPKASIQAALMPKFNQKEIAFELPYISIKN